MKEHFNRRKKYNNIIKREERKEQIKKYELSAILLQPTATVPFLNYLDDK